MGYEYKTRIGFSKVDSDRKMTLAALIDEFQDCGGFHGEDCGYSNKGLADMGLAWILSSWQIVIRKMPDLSEWVRLATYPYKYKHFMANRYFLLESESGEEYVRADSVWILMDMKDYKPVRITEDMADAYGGKDGNSDIFRGFDFGGRKINKEGQFEKRDPILVAPYMIDTNHHVNNQQYVKIAQCYLPEEMEWNSFRAEYTKQARLGDHLNPEICVMQDKCQIALLDDAGEQYFIGEWMKRDL